MKAIKCILTLISCVAISYGAVAQENATKVTTKPAYIHISKQDMMLYLCDSLGGHIAAYPMACGKNVGNKQMVGDMKTPEGVFEVQQIQDASGWTHDFNDGKGVIKGAYGPWFIRLKTPGHTGIGIHGTHAPESIGTRATEGCIRLHNENVAKLKPQIKVGMPVIISSSDADMQVNVASGISEQTPMYLHISKQDMKIYVRNLADNAIAEFPMACGFYGNRVDSRDLRRTPEGVFRVIAIEGTSLVSGEGGDTESYGPRFVRIGVKGYNDFGISSSENSKLFEQNGGRTTDGRIVVSAESFKALEGYLTAGMAVMITTSETDLRVNQAK